MINTELNDLRKSICLRKSDLLLREFQFVMSLMEQGIHCLPCSYINDVIDLLP